MRSRIVRLKADKTRRLRWLAASSEAPAHLCVEQGRIAAPICGARPKQLFNHVRPGGRRCLDCHALDQAMKAAKRAQRIAAVKNFFKRAAAWLRLVNSPINTVTGGFAK